MRFFSNLKTFWNLFFDFSLKPEPAEHEVLFYLQEQAPRLLQEDWLCILQDIQEHLLSSYHILGLRVHISYPTVYPLQGGSYLDTTRVMISVRSSSLFLDYCYSRP